MDSVEKPSTLLGGHSLSVITRGRHRRGWRLGRLPLRRTH
jgi:hypothetical protein